jgi:hypothetical protein
VGTLPWSAAPRRVARYVLALVFVLAVSAPARAQRPPQDAIALRYAAPEGCPTPDTFRELVLRRASRAVLAEGGARVIDVRIETDPPPARARIALPSEQGHADTRAIEGPTCASVTDAAALLVALYLDAQIGAQIETSPVERPPPKTTGEPRVRPAPPRPAPPSVSVPARAWQVSGELGAHLALASGLAPATSYGERLFLGVVVRSDERSLRWLSPSLRVGVASLRSDRFAESAHARLRVVELALCPVVLPILSVGLRPCALGSLGVYSVSAATTTRSGEADRPWRTWGAGARAEWKTPLSDAVRVELALDVNAPLVQDRFFRGTTLIHTTPRATLTGALGIAVRWP